MDCLQGVQSFRQMWSLLPWKSNDGDGLDIMISWLDNNNGDKNYDSIFRGT